MGGTVENGKYEVVKVLGAGAFGEVVLARDKTSEQEEYVAIKKMERAHLSHKVESEILNHSELNHPHIVKLKEIYITSRHMNIVMECASSGSLFEYVSKHKRLPEGMARWFFQQLILALDYCHQKGVGHRDIKLENVLLHTDKRCPRPLVKICDFGYSKGDNRSLCVSKVGTLLYMAPEVLDTQGNTYSARVADLWSCGVLLYTMLVGTYPFRLPVEEQHQSINQQAKLLHRMMLQQQYIIPTQLALTSGCKQLLSGLLTPLANQRITMEQVLQHPWFREGLPPTALNMTPKCLALGRVCKQSEADMRRIVANALAVQVDELDMHELGDQLDEMNS